jgi:hypothetical protein
MSNAKRIVEAALQPKDVVSVSLWDGAALYVDGLLVCDNYTRNVSDVLVALGVPVREGLIRNQKAIDGWPARLEDIPAKAIEWH